MVNESIGIKQFQAENQEEIKILKLTKMLLVLVKRNYNLPEIIPGTSTNISYQQKI